MKRESIYFFIENNCIYVYFKKKNREVINRLNTSSFFKYGEISSVVNLQRQLNKIFSRYITITNLIKPNIYILYNDIGYCDVEFLYKSSFEILPYNKINFMKLSSLLSSINSSEDVVYFDKKNYYSLVDKEILGKENLKDSSIIIGEIVDKYIHYNDDRLVWKTFKKKTF